MITSDCAVLIIPTLGRVQQQLTLACLPPRWAERAWLCVPIREAAQHTHERLLVHDNLDCIGKTRQFVLEHVSAPIVFMLDDDLEFYVRRCYQPEPRLRGAAPDEVGECLDLLTAWLEEDDGIGMVAVSQRRGNNWTRDRWTESAGRPIRVWGYRSPTAQQLAASGFRFDAFHSVEDFHLALSMLRAGYRIRTTFHYAQGQKASQTAGGCALNRTADIHDADIRKLAETHAGYVKVVQRTTKGGWFGGQPRTDAVISWAKAAADGQRARAGSAPSPPEDQPSLFEALG